VTTPKLEYPALYESASAGSARAQSGFLWTIRAEYFLLFCVSVSLSAKGLIAQNRLLISIILLVLAGLFVFKIVKELDQDWYRCRALAESVKTSTWRFCMRAHPFVDAEKIVEPRANFRNLLRDILKANQNVAHNLSTDDAEQVTESMLAVRSLELAERIAYYVQHRISEQRTWYTKKSAINKRALHFWVVVTILIYVGAAVSLNGDQLGFAPVTMAFDPLIVLATSALGWLQMKRHSELLASYNLTAHEIGIIKSSIDAVKTEEQFSDFVNEAELAFSREHTQWVARRDIN
jgi:SMODS and SLOG-associating 2TM effector domain 1/SMODS and SLOG-associating 2TM effector domain 3